MTACTPHLHQLHFQGFNDDGTGESDQTAIAAVDTDFSIDVDVVFGMRLEIEESNNCSSMNNQFHLQHNIGGAGWITTTTGTSGVRLAASAVVADGVATTNRISGSALGFVAGECDSEGATANVTLANQHTEMHFFVELVGADLVDQDTIQFRAITGVDQLTEIHATPTVTANKGAGAQTISPTGIASTLAFGTIQQLARTLEGLTGIASTLAFGTATMQPGPVTISPGGIASGLAFGSPTVTLSGVTISPDGIASGLAFGTPIMQPGPVTISPSGVASTLAFGTPSVTAIIGPTGIASTLAFGTARIDQQIAPAGVASGLGFGSAAIVLTIEPSGAASILSFGTPTVTLGGMTISPSGIASGLAFGTPTVTVAISPAGILSGYVELAVSLAGTVAFATVLVGKAE